MRRALSYARWALLGGAIVGGAPIPAACAASAPSQAGLQEPPIHPDADHPLFALPPPRAFSPQTQGFAVAVPWEAGGAANALSGIGVAPFDPLRAQTAPAYVPASDFDLRLKPMGFLGLGQAEIFRGQLLFTPKNSRVQMEFRFDRPEAAFVTRF